MKESDNYLEKYQLTLNREKNGNFSVCAPCLVDAYFLQPPDARAIVLHKNLPCSDTCSVTGGHNVLGGWGVTA